MRTLRYYEVAGYTGEKREVMISFNYRRRELKEIQPFGNEQTGRSLHWFGLTDAYYWISIGQTELFRYTDSFLKHHNLNRDIPYVDYQFARIYQDFFWILPHIAEPVPDEIYDRISDANNLIKFKEMLRHWLQNLWNEEDKQYDDIYVPASNWIQDRSLDSGYLLYAPEIYFVRNRDKITVYWYCNKSSDEGINVWRETQGSYTLDFNEFVDGISSSFGYFFSEMDKQVRLACENWPFRNVQIDFNLLKDSQVKFKKEMEQAISDLRSPSLIGKQDWSEVRKSITSLIQSC